MPKSETLRAHRPVGKSARENRRASVSDLVSSSPSVSSLAGLSSPPSSGLGPARGYSWPPFEPGNTANLTTGLDSERAIEAKAAEVHDAILSVAPWLAEPQYLPSVARYIRASARELLAHRAILAAGEKVSPRLVEAATAAARLAQAMGAEMGLTPRGHASLRLLLAEGAGAEIGLEDLIEKGRKVRAANSVQIETVSDQEVIANGGL